MVVNNYWKALACISDHSSNYTLKNTVGNNAALDITFNDTQFRTNLVGAVGSGSTVPTLDDYCLESEITSFDSVSTNVNNLYENGTLKTVITISGINNTQNNITISEVGIKRLITNNSNNAIPFLFVRELLSEPITVSAGNGFSITIEWAEA